MKFNSYAVKIIALTLTIIMLIGIVPAGAIDLSAIKSQPKVVENNENEKNNNKNKNENENTPDIIGEIESQRTEKTKMFLCSDNSKISYVSSRPIHYKENNKWVEIDNTLVESKNEKGEKIYKNKKNSFSVEFPENLSSNVEISYTKEGYKLTVKLDNSVIKKDKIKANLEDISNGKKSKVEKAINKKIGKYDPNKLTDELIYKSVDSNVDVEYVTIPEGVKENIILNKKPLEQPVLTFTIQSENLDAELQLDNSLYFYPKDNHKGEPIFVIPAPVMYDTMIDEKDKGAGENKDIKIELSKGKKGTYKLTYLPSLEWLQSSECNYPVKIDPVITTSQSPMVENRELIKDTFVSSGKPTSEFHTNKYVFVGCDSDNTGAYGVERGLFRFDDLPAINAGDKISEATFNLYRPFTSTENCYINVHKLTSAYNSDNVTWNTQPSIDNIVSDYVNVNNCGWFSFNITNIVSEWYEGQPNLGVMLKGNDESSAAVDRAFATALNTDDASLWPVLYIRYYNTTGIENYWTYHSQDLGRAGVASVNDFTGNLVVTRDDIGVTGNVMPVNISHVYNSNDKDINLGYGKGWRLNYGQKLEYVTVKVGNSDIP